MTNSTLTKIEEVTKKIDELLQRNGLKWYELLKIYRNRRIEKDIWQEITGMWAKKKIDPLKYERRIRKELERMPL